MVIMKTMITRKSIGIILFLSLATQIWAQNEPSFALAVSDDSILMGNYFEIKYEANNLQGEFELPEFNEFEIVSGPNHSSSMSIINGQQSSSNSISLLLKPKSIENLTLPPAYFVTQDSVWEVNPRDITVLPNPDGIVTESRLSVERNTFNIFDNWGSTNPKERKKKKKKLKETKI